MENHNLLVSESSDIEKAAFYKKTYMHVALALLAFIAVECLFFRVVPEEAIIWMLSGKFIWLFLLGAFWLGSTISTKMSFAPTRGQQYAGLGLYVILEAVIFLPLLYIAAYSVGSAVILQAAIVTLFMFTGLTAVVFLTNTDFSFLRSAIIMGGFIALGAIVAGMIFGFDLGLWFSIFMVVLASGSILYQTGQIKDNYETGQYVGAALQLFASVMLLFWYVLRILMSRRS
ncbi:Bax inhibitor-1/YccA family protein [Flavobacterium silvaticum]|uniref:Permease n=1 Tax=Flavobacterium silvaticum TaxID=1852020 RepID=A0A972JH21_9FLAO|nr:Bax inhibitor-1 family protein [Flavobacterium silvaticum]NMH28781.1 permease [Flavobacterium silvaticum]